MQEHVQGILNAKGKHFAIIISRFNEFISGKLLEGALDCLSRHQADEKNIKIYWVPGSFEMPVAKLKLEKGIKTAYFEFSLL